METPKKKKPIWKKWWFWLIIIVIGALSSATVPESDKEDLASVTNDTVADPDQSDDNDADSDDTDADDADAPELGLESESTKKPNKIELHLAANSVIFYGDVVGDKTGNWRYAVCQANESQEQFAVDYYNTYFESDDEIHFVVNEDNGTLATVKMLFDGILNVVIYDYDTSEQFYDLQTIQEAKGDELGSYLVTIATGEIEDLQASEEDE